MYYKGGNMSHPIGQIVTEFKMPGCINLDNQFVKTLRPENSIKTSRIKSSNIIADRNYYMEAIRKEQE